MPDCNVPVTPAEERDRIIDKIKSIVSTKGYVVEAEVEKDHYRLVSVTPGYHVRHFWFDDDNKIRCAPGAVHSLQLLGLNPLVVETPATHKAGFFVMAEAVSKHGYTVHDADDEDSYLLEKPTGGRILVWFDDDNQLRCTRPNLKVLQGMGLNPVAEAAHPAHEADPSGISPHTPGAKLDAGKNRLGLVLHGFAKALEEVGRVGTFGANKYTDNGWVSVPNGHARYTDAAYRHMLKEAQGEILDPDSGLQHAAHTAWNALARLELKLREYDNAA